MRIILDTSFLVTTIKFKVDIFSEFVGNKFFVLDSIIKELEKISKRKGKDSVAAKVALGIIRIKDIKVLKSRNGTDESLLIYGKEGFTIATQDSELRKRLKKERVKIIYLRGKKYLVTE
jgi:rRNA-processing protein FCF1